jgi:hypothetical protein
LFKKTKRENKYLPVKSHQAYFNLLPSCYGPFKISWIIHIKYAYKDIYYYIILIVKIRIKGVFICRWLFENLCHISIIK